MTQQFLSCHFAASPCRMLWRSGSGCLGTLKISLFGDAPSACGPCRQGGEGLSVQGQELHALVPAPVPCSCQRRMPVFSSSQPFGAVIFVAVPSLAT